MNDVQAGRRMVFERQQQALEESAIEFFWHYDRCQRVAAWGYYYSVDLADMLAELRGKQTP